MSRHRHAYDEDDMYDYDDYDDDEYCDQGPIVPKSGRQEPKLQKASTPLATKVTKTSKSNNNSVSKQSLNTTPIATKQSSKTTPITVFTKNPNDLVPDVAKLEIGKFDHAISAESNACGVSDDEVDCEHCEVSADKFRHVTLVVAGHVDAGKSTLVGNILFQCGAVSKKVMRKNEKESKQIGKGSFAIAWIMDENESERQHGVTIEVGERFVPTQHLVRG